MGAVSVFGPYRHQRGYSIEVRGPGGRRATVYKTEREALHAILDAVAEAKAAVPVLIDDAIDAYVEQLRERGRRESTIGEAEYRLRPLGRIVANVGDLKPDHVRRRLAGEGRLDKRPHAELSVATKRGTLARIRDACRFWIERGWLARDPTAKIEVKGKVGRGKPTLTPREARLLDDVLVDDSSEAATAVMLALRLGLRSGEIRRLRVKALDLEGDPPTLHVARETTKSDHGVRTLPLHAPLPARMAKLTHGRELGDLVFAGRKGKPRGSDWVRAATVRYCQRAGVTVVTAHGLRGTHRRLALDGGAAVEAAALALGHGSTTVGERHYAPGAERGAAAGKVQRLFGGRGAGRQSRSRGTPGEDGEQTDRPDLPLPRRHSTLRAAGPAMWADSRGFHSRASRERADVRATTPKARPR